MAKLMINGDTVDATYCGKASEVEEMYDFSYYCKLDINNWRLHDYHDDDVMTPIYIEAWLEGVYYYDYHYDYGFSGVNYSYVKVSNVSIRKIVSKDPKYQTYFDEHRNDEGLWLCDALDEDEDLVKEFFRDVRLVQ